MTGNEGPSFRSPSWAGPMGLLAAAGVTALGLGLTHGAGLPLVPAVALIGGIMLLAGTPKVLGLVPPEGVAQMGLTDWIGVIGVGELATAVLLLLPRTASLGVLLASSFWGGAICLHMTRGELFVVQSVL